MTGQPTQMDRREVLAYKLHELERRHRTLDETIREMEERAELRDSLDLRRLKKEKLSLKDQIIRLRDIVDPDIIA